MIANTAWAPAVVVTVHPSAVLRADDGERYFDMLVADLKLARAAFLERHLVTIYRAGTLEPAPPSACAAVSQATCKILPPLSCRTAAARVACRA